MEFISDITVQPVQQMGGDYMVVAAAKVSTNGADALRWAEPENKEESIGLINYLMKHRHGTPFEHAAMTFFVHAPIFVYREWHRHRIGVSYNEESGRYTQLKPVFYVPSPDRPMFKVDAWKPGRPKFLTIDQYAAHNRREDTWPSLPRPVPVKNIDMEPERWAFNCLIENLKDDYTRSYAHYEENLAMGFDPGLARVGLPVGIYSSQWFTCNPRSLMAFVSLRVHEPEALFVSYPLWEIDVAAQQCEELLKIGWPETHKALVANKRVGP